jgi:hypothetical protein
MCTQAQRLNEQAIKPTQKSKSVTSNLTLLEKTYTQGKLVAGAVMGAQPHA